MGTRRGYRCGGSSSTARLPCCLSPCFPFFFFLSWSQSLFLHSASMRVSSSLAVQPLQVWREHSPPAPCAVIGREERAGCCSAAPRLSPWFSLLSCLSPPHIPFARGRAGRRRQGRMRSYSPPSSSPILLRLSPSSFSASHMRGGRQYLALSAIICDFLHLNANNRI